MKLPMIVPLLGWLICLVLFAVTCEVVAPLMAAGLLGLIMVCIWPRDTAIDLMKPCRWNRHKQNN